MDLLREISISPDAFDPLERIIASCIEVEWPVPHLDRRKPQTLADLEPYAPIVAKILAIFCQSQGAKILGRKEVIDHFAGTSHAEKIHRKLGEDNYVIMTTRKLMKVRMREVNIHLNSEINNAIFSVLDLALACKVFDVRGRYVDVNVFGKRINHCVRPRGLDIWSNDWVLCHKGAVIERIDDPAEAERIQKITGDSPDYERLAELIALMPEVIDCQNFCPSTPNKKDGCDLTAWNLERL